MKPFTFLLTAVLLLFGVNAMAADRSSAAQQLFDKAGSAYSGGDFLEAAELFEQFIAEHGYSPSVLYNLGNSYAALERPGKAIVNYQRGLLLAPTDSDLQSNLKQLREENGIFENELNVQEKIVNSLTINQWLWFGFSAITLTAAVTLVTLKSSFSRRTITTVYGLCLLSAVIAGYSVFHQYGVWQGYIITSPDTRLTISPFSGAAPVGDIKEGSLVYELKQHGDYLYISDEGNRKGWLNRSALEPIIP